MTEHKPYSETPSSQQPQWLPQLQAHEARLAEEAASATRLNQRAEPASVPNLSKENRRASVLVEFPEKNFEAFVIQWKHSRPTVLIQLKRDVLEPLQFPGRLIPKVEFTPEQIAAQEGVLENPLSQFIDPAQSRAFTKTADLADILFSQRAYELIRPRATETQMSAADFAELVLPADAMWECRQEAMNALGIVDQAGF